MKAYVSQIKPAASGFGLYERGEAALIEGDWESADELASHIVRKNSNFFSYGIDPTLTEMGDEDGKIIAEKLREVTGAVHGGHDILAAYYLDDGSVIVENIEFQKVKLRIWWIPQIPMKPFRVSVNSVSEAILLLNTLADYDAFQYENNIKPDYSNVGGLECYEDGEWIEWEDDDGFDIYASINKSL